MPRISRIELRKVFEHVLFIKAARTLPLLLECSKSCLNLGTGKPGAGRGGTSLKLRDLFRRECGNEPAGHLAPRIHDLERKRRLSEQLCLLLRKRQLCHDSTSVDLLQDTSCMLHTLRILCFAHAEVTEKIFQEPHLLLGPILIASISREHFEVLAHLQQPRSAEPLQIRNDV